jgi:hypothetical protein
MKHLFFILALFGLFTLNVKAQKIDSNCAPKVPNNWTVVLDSPLGKEVDLSKINFKPNPIKEGTDLSNTFKKEAENGLSSCYLDFFLDKKENQKFIPEDWKNIVVIFTGTVFQEGKDIVYKTMFYDKKDAIWIEGRNYGNYILENSFSVKVLLN